MPTAPVLDINYTAPTTTICINNSHCLASSGTVAIDLPHLVPPGTNMGTIIPSFANNLLSIGIFCDAGCAAIFTKATATIYSATGDKIMQGPQVLHGAKIGRLNLTTETVHNAQATHPHDLPAIILLSTTMTKTFTHCHYLHLHCYKHPAHRPWLNTTMPHLAHPEPTWMSKIKNGNFCFFPGLILTNVA